MTHKIPCVGARLWASRMLLGVSARELGHMSIRLKAEAEVLAATS